MTPNLQQNGEPDVVSPVGNVSNVLPQDGKAWWKKPHLLKLNFYIFSFILFSSSNGYDGALMNGLQALPLWQDFMGHPTGAWLGFMNACTSLGGVIMAWPSAWVSQKWGRKSGIYLGYVFLVVSVILQTVAPNPAAFIAGRILIGFAGQLYGNSTPLLIAETAYPSHRAIATALYMCGWYIGSLIAAWVTFGMTLPSLISKPPGLRMALSSNTTLQHRLELENPRPAANRNPHVLVTRCNTSP